MRENASDFEITARLSARELVGRIPPDTEMTGEDVVLVHAESKRHLPEEMKPGEMYEDVVVEKRVTGEIPAD